MDTTFTIHSVSEAFHPISSTNEEPALRKRGITLLCGLSAMKRPLGILFITVTVGLIGICLLLHPFNGPNISVAAFWMCIISFLGVGWAIVWLCFHGLLRIVSLLTNVRNHSWNFLHYLIELEGHLALLVSINSNIVILLLLKGNEWPKQLTSIIVEQDRRLLLVKLFSGLGFAAILFAVKCHWINQTAMEFNFGNYSDRIAESLFADKIVTRLLKSRHTYKLRQKWRQSKNGNFGMTVPHGRRHDHKRKLSWDPSFLSCKEDSHIVDISANLTTRSAEIIEATAVVSDDFVASNGRISKTGEEKVMKQPFVPGGLPGATATLAEKKQNFDEFYALANRTMAKFSSNSQLDVRYEIGREAKRISSKLLKYLKAPGGGSFLCGKDLQPYFAETSEYFSAVEALRSYADGGSAKSRPRKSSTHAFSQKTTNEAIQNVPPLDHDNVMFSEEDLQRAITAILEQLFGIIKSMQTIEMALDKVDLILTGAILLGLGVGVAVVLGEAVQLLLALSTAFSAAAFAFGTTVRNLFESIIFILLMHPFDVGDRVFIPLGTISPSAANPAGPAPVVPATMTGSEGMDNLVVQEMHLLSTVFERWDGVKIYVPNNVLATKPILNIRRSGPLLECIKLQVDLGTPLDLLETLRDRLHVFIKNEPADYGEIFRLFIDSIDLCNRVNLLVYFQHASNWQDLNVQMERHTRFLFRVKAELDDLGIGYLPPVQRIVMITSSDGGVFPTSPAEVSTLNRRTMNQV